MDFYELFEKMEANNFFSSIVNLCSSLVKMEKLTIMKMRL